MMELKWYEWLIGFIIYIVSAICIAIYFKKYDNRKHETDVLIPIFMPFLNTILLAFGIFYIILDCILSLISKIPFVTKFLDWIDKEEEV